MDDSLTANTKDTEEMKKEKTSQNRIFSFEVADKEVEKENKWDGSIDSSVIHGAINVSKNGLGAVSLFIAGGFYEGGLIFGGFILLLSCILSALSFYIIAKCCHLTDSSSYTEIFRQAFGKRYGWICSLIIGLFTLNILVLYILVLGVFCQDAAKQWHLLDWIPDEMSNGVPIPTWKNIFLIVTISVFIAIPLSFLKKLKYFKYTSSFGLFSLIFACFLHFFVCVLGMNDTPEKGDITYGPKGFWNSIIFFANFIGGFNCHFNAANYYKSTGCNIKKFRLIIMISFSFMLFVNVMMGYCAFFNKPHVFSGHQEIPSIMLFNGDSRSALQAAGLTGCLFIALNIAFGFGLVGFATRLSLNEFLRFLGSKFEIFSRFRYGSNDKSNKGIDDPSADVTINSNSGGDNSSSSLIDMDGEDARRNETQADDRHVPLTCTVIFVVAAIATILIVASRGNPEVSLGACGLALNIAVAVFGTNVALTLPGFIYYKILRQKDSRDGISTQDWIIISSLIFVGLFASIAGILKIIVIRENLL